MRGDDINSPRGSYASRRSLIGGRLLQRAEDNVIRTTVSLSRRQIGATRRAGTGTFLDDSRAFVSSIIPEGAPRGRVWHGLAGWMKSQIQAKTRIRGRDWARGAFKMVGLCGAIEATTKLIDRSP
jgi:hypothetical protein